MRVDPKGGSLINNAWLVRVLADSPNALACGECGSRMFVKGASGLCPVCFTRQRLLDEQIESIVDDEVGSALRNWSAVG